MTHQQVGTGRGGVSWFQFRDTDVFAPPKTGFTTLQENYPSCRRVFPYPIEQGRQVIGSVRDPVDRFISAFNMLVAEGGKRIMKENLMIEQHGQAWFDHWFPDYTTIRDPIGHCRRFLQQAIPDILSVADELHFCSQTRCYEKLLGMNWRDYPNLHLINYRDWFDHLYSVSGKRPRQIGNRGVYDRVPKHYYNTLHDEIRLVFEDDWQLWNSVCINTV